MSLSIFKHNPPKVTSEKLQQFQWKEPEGWGAGSLGSFPSPASASCMPACLPHRCPRVVLAPRGSGECGEHWVSLALTDLLSPRLCLWRDTTFSGFFSFGKPETELGVVEGRGGDSWARLRQVQSDNSSCCVGPKQKWHNDRKTGSQKEGNGPVVGEGWTGKAKHPFLRVWMENTPLCLVFLYFTNGSSRTSVLQLIFKVKCSNSSLWMILGHEIAT